MGALQNRARSALNKLSFFVADRKAAEDTLHKQFGTRDPFSLNDSQAKQFANSVFNAYGAFKAKSSPSDNDYEPLVPSTDGSRKAQINPTKIYERWNRRQAGVPIQNPTDSKMDADDD